MITGVVGVIRWHYYPAAAINGYTVTRVQKDGRVWALRAIVIDRNAYNLAQRPLTFSAKHKRGEWRWPILDGSLATETQNGVPVLTARLGPEESSHVQVRTP